MKRLKKGDIVGRISYGKDIVFKIEKIIIDSNKNEIAILKGITERIKADSFLDDLVLLDEYYVKECINKINKQLENRIENFNNKIEIKNSKKNLIKDFFREKRDSDLSGTRKMIRTGRILHLDGDRKYADKSAAYYKKIGLFAVVKNIEERRQPSTIGYLIRKYNPDMLVITGHDGMIKNKTGYNDLSNYRNSKYFIQSVKEARRYRTQEQMPIFAGACQSFYEGIMSAGANFASSPARILIDFADPLIIAEKIVTTDEERYLSITDIENELRNGRNGISGVGAKGKSKKVKI